MRKNTRKALEAFLNRKQVKGRTISSQPKGVYTYTTCLLTSKPGEDAFLLNKSRYSRTTSRQQREICAELLARGYRVYPVFDCPWYSTSEDLQALHEYQRSSHLV